MLKECRAVARLVVADARVHHDPELADFEDECLDVGEKTPLRRRVMRLQPIIFEDGAGRRLQHGFRRNHKSIHFEDPRGGHLADPPFSDSWGAACLVHFNYFAVVAGATGRPPFRFVA